MLDAVSRTRNLSVLLWAVKASCTTWTAQAVASFRSEFVIVWLLFEGGYYSRAASIWRNIVCYKYTFCWHDWYTLLMCVTCTLYVYVSTTALLLNMYACDCSIVCHGIVLAWTQNHGTGFAQTDHWNTLQHMQILGRSSWEWTAACKS